MGHHRPGSLRALLAALFLLVALTLRAAIPLPPPTEWLAPATHPAAPGDAFTPATEFTGPAPVAQAPVISGWNKTIRPDESFTLSGIRFTLRQGAAAGTDTTVWLYAFTPAGGTLRQLPVWGLENDHALFATVPADVPFGTYLVWVENEAGASSPVCLNRTDAQWVGPLGNTIAADTPGLTKRILGRNLARDHGTATSQVYLVRAGSTAFEPLPLTSVNPYDLAFTLPALPAGEHQLYVHNGHGGALGWSGPLKLAAAAPFVRDSFEITVTPSGGNDTAALQAAIDTVGARPGGGTVRLAAGVFNFDNRARLFIPARVRLLGAGASATELRFSSAGLRHSIHISGSHITLEAFRFTLLARPEYGAISVDDNERSDDFRALDLEIRRDRSVLDCAWGFKPSGSRIEITRCLFELPLTAGGEDLWQHANTFHGGDLWTEGAIQMTGGTRWILEKNHFETPEWKDSSERGDQWCKRIFSGSWGNKHLYFHANTARDVAEPPGGNKGEVFLFHYAALGWYAQVASVSGDTLAIRTDGTLRGRSDLNVDRFPPARSTADWIENNERRFPGASTRVAIVDGPGVGQTRAIASYTATTITVAEPWRVPPTAESVIVMTNFSEDVVIYQNIIEAFPPGVRAGSSASILASLDGQCLDFAVEGNTSRRTFFAASVCGTPTSPSFWNEFRDQQSLELQHSGFAFNSWIGDGADRIGTQLLGNGDWGSTYEIIPAFQEDWQLMFPSYVSPPVARNTMLVEHATGTGSHVGAVTGGGLALLRKNNFAVRANPGLTRSGNATGILVGAGPAAFVENTLAGAVRPWILATGGSATANSDRPGNETRYGNDDDPSTYWVTGNPNVVSTWQVDLQTPRDLTGARFLDRYYHRYRIDVSTTGLDGSWTTVATNNGDAATTAHSFTAAGARFVRVTSTETVFFGFAEFRVFDTTGANVAVAQPARDQVTAPVHVARLAGPGSVELEIGNTGPLTSAGWSVASTSHPWLDAQPLASSTLPPGAVGDRLLVTIDATAPAASATPVWGTVTLVSTTGRTARVGVRLGLGALAEAESATPAPAPVFSPAGGEFSGSLSVTLSASPGSAIYYTLDGSAPSAETGAPYGAPLLLTQSTRLRALAVMPGRAPSAVVTADYAWRSTPLAATLLDLDAAPGFSTDASAYELGVVLTANEPGRLTAIRYYKSPGETGAHTGRVWSFPDGTLLASAAFTNETASGWQQTALATPLTLSAGQTVVVSVNDNSGGGYAYLVGGFALPLESGPLSAPAGAGVFSTTPGTFPNESFQNANYYRDAIFIPDGPALTPWQTWQQEHFSAAALADPDAATTLWGHTADPDSDGLVNLLEYALARDPLAPESEPHVRITNMSPNGQLSLSFLRARAELTYTVEASSDLVSWKPLATNPGTVSLIQEVTVTDTATAFPRRFLRLRVSTP
jgi:hypothetical protein